jgi:hypothetical protein
LVLPHVLSSPIPIIFFVSTCISATSLYAD